MHQPDVVLYKRKYHIAGKFGGRVVGEFTVMSVCLGKVWQMDTCNIMQYRIWAKDI